MTDAGFTPLVRRIIRKTAWFALFGALLLSVIQGYGQYIGKQRDLNKTLNEIEAKTREVGRRSQGAEAEQWAAEAATHLRFVKNAWRNQAMHPRHTYDEERAVTIFESARSFMQHPFLYAASVRETQRG